ncbi:MAG: lytic transglycosylase domain-containing protein [Candidatus Cloacimonadaceae bacterium]|nr:lytic transglycosylase domain-containing protein [Candidatus Cloacimonadaceae bacterium]
MSKKKAKGRTRKLLIGFTVLLLVLLITLYNPVSVRLMTVGVAVWYGIDPVIFYRLIRTESAFRSFAVSPRSAIGLGQIRESTAYYIHDKHKRGMLFIPFYNLRLSAQYIKYLSKRFDGNWTLILAAYNWGETRVSRRMRNTDIDPDQDYRHRFKDIPETYNYINKILPPAKKA